MEELEKYLIYSGISTTLFLILLLTKGSKNNRGRGVFSFILIGFLIILLTYSSFHLQYEKLSRIIAPLGFIVTFALGPLFLFYINAIYNGKTNFKHLIPFVSAVIIITIPSYFVPIESVTFSVLIIVFTLAGLVHFLYYLYKSSLLIKRFRNLIKNNYSSISAFDLHWLSIWIKGFVIFLIIDTIIGVFSAVFPDFPDFIVLNIVYLTGLIWYIGYYGVNQVSVFADQPKKMVEDNNEKKNQPLNSVYDCDSNEFKALKDKLEKLFQEKELFKKETLSLKDTAEALNITDKKLSHILNECLQSNFYKFVNTYRINHFKSRVEKGDAESLTLLAIAYESGFNSKATFNRIFKQQEGITPFQFKKNIEKKNNASSISKTEG